MDKPEFRVASFSGGKDSTAMVLRLLEEGHHLDAIIFCDTGLEFPEMYNHIDLVEKNIGRPITRLKNKDSFEYLMFDHPVNRKQVTSFAEKYGLNHTGYGWAGPRMRWCTTRLKDIPREHFLREIRKKHKVVEYVGIAADEQYRLERSRNKNPNHRHPLVDWGMTEADCLQYCYDRGYDWGGLYNTFKRVSCWCCPLQSLPELRKLYHTFPDLWEKLKDWDSRTWRQFREDYAVADLEIRFDLEDEYLRSDRSISDRAFFDALRKELDSHAKKSDPR